MIPPTNLPTVAELAPWLERLSENPGSCVTIVLQLPEGQNYCRVGIAHLTAEERSKLRTALQGINKARRNRGLATTEEKP